MRGIVRAAAAVVAFDLLSLVHAQSQHGTPSHQRTFRDAFTLRLRIDKQHYYEQRFDPVPYVADNSVYLFSGERFGIRLITRGDQITDIDYETEESKSDLLFTFSQEYSPEGPFMSLKTVNRTKHRLFFDAFVTFPQRKGLRKTSVLPVDPELSSFEAWPDPIVQLVLENFRFSEGSARQTR